MAGRRAWSQRWRRAATPAERERWAAYLAGVEPALAAVPRVHRFARPPVLGDGATEPSPVAVWIAPGPPDAVARSRHALEAGTRAAVQRVEAEDLAAALAATRADWLLAVRAGDEPAPLAVERLGQAAALAPDAAVITADEDRLDERGVRVEPQFRPGPSPDRWLARDDSGAMLLLARGPALAALASPGLGLLAADRPGDPPAAASWHPLALHLAGRDGERHAHVPTILVHRGGPPVAAADAAVGRVLAAWEPSARIEASAAAALRRVRRPLHGEPVVEVVICLRDRAALLVRSAGTLLARTAWDRLRLAVVDNGSAEPATHAALARLARDPRVRIIRDERPFNYAGLNNRAASGSVADVLVLLNNDTEIVEPGWLETLLEEAVRPEVGAVAPLLLYPDGLVQHAGAALGLHGYAGHPFAGLRPDAATPFGRPAEGTRNWLAVTAACLAVERSKWEAVGGFDERFVVAGNDVDLCLRLTAAGHRSLCVTDAAVLHDESRSRGSHVDPGDFVSSERSYGTFRTVGDPFYNPNLTLDATDCAVRIPGPPA